MVEVPEDIRVRYVIMLLYVFFLIIFFENIDIYIRTL